LVPRWREVEERQKGMAIRFVVSVPATAVAEAEVVYAENSVQNKSKSQFDRRMMVSARIDG
jgi:hypothetical protein